MISNKDKELFKVMEDSLKRYLKAAGLISQAAFEMLSKHNGLLWSEISTQRDILEEMTKIDTIEETVQIIEKHETEKQETEKEDNEKQTTEKQEIGLGLEEDGPVNLFNKVVKFMKNQKCDELQWVRTYSFKYTYEDFEDFQIKYFEHKDPLQAAKNYVMFGNTRKSYSIRKSGNDILGDTSECFEIILNLSELFKID